MVRALGLQFLLADVVLLAVVAARLISARAAIHDEYEVVIAGPGLLTAVVSCFLIGLALLVTSSSLARWLSKGLDPAG